MKISLQTIKLGSRHWFYKKWSGYRVSPSPGICWSHVLRKFLQNTLSHDLFCNDVMAQQNSPALFGKGWWPLQKLPEKLHCSKQPVLVDFCWATAKCLVQNTLEIMKGCPSFQHFQKGFINIIHLSNRILIPKQIAKSLRSSWPFSQPNTKQHSPMRVCGEFRGSQGFVAWNSSSW